MKALIASDSNLVATLLRFYSILKLNLKPKFPLWKDYNMTWPASA